jgi:hypothetical protein
MKIEKKKKSDKGSVLVLTIIAVLILSIMVTGLLNVGTTEIYTTQNFHLSKSAYYTAVQGIEEIRDMIWNFKEVEESPANIIVLPPAEAYSSTGGFLRFYVTGSLKDLEDILAGSNPSGVPIQEFMGFETPPPTAYSIGTGSKIKLKAWKVQVTAKIQANKRTTYSEIIAGILQVIKL